MIDQALVDFTWATDTKGFHIPGNVDLTERDEVPAGERIIRNGGPLQKYQPERIERLFRDFLLVRTPADLLQFVNRRGPLTREGFYCEASDEDFGEPNEMYLREDGEGEPLDLGLEYSGWFRDVLMEKHKPSRVARSFEAFRLEKYQVVIVPDVKRGFRFKFFPKNLLDYLTLRLAHAVLALPAYSSCLWCGEFFAKGVGTKRRGDAQFCSDQHRIDYNSQKRSLDPKILPGNASDH
jgi:hypothetical protein